MMNIVIMIVTALFWVGIIAAFVIRNRTLDAHLDQVVEDCKDYRADRDVIYANWQASLAREADLHKITEQLQEEILVRDEHLAHALNERNDAMMHLERTLDAAVAEFVVPDHISVEAGINGIYYTFKYDPPEFATITPITESVIK